MSLPRLYQPSPLDTVEDPEQYRPHGLHPVHLGDILSKRYKIIHKLGHGGFSTVWLARDLHAGPSPRYVSVKLLTASAPRPPPEAAVLAALHAAPPHPGQSHLAALLDTFTVAGPNGTHTTLVTPLYGPSVQALARARGRGWLRPAVARALARQLALALSHIHACGLAHGDLTCANIVLQLRGGLAGWSEEAVYAAFGAPVRAGVAAIGAAPPGGHAPRYLVAPLDFAGAGREWLAPRVTVVDFGTAFSLRAPPRDGVGVPLAYCAPEAAFAPACVGAAADLWALGCCVFEMRAGAALFDMFFGTRDEVVRQVVQCLGRLPEALWRMWEARGAFFDDAGRPNGTTAVAYPLREMLEDVGREEGGGGAAEGAGKHRTGELWQDVMEPMEAAEVGAMEAVLRRLLRYNPDERVAAAEVCNDPWFTGKF
ncbi:protein kinase [Geopyxis carbonaria]|nr:protein kinase [Geopyxis carbonaria]